MELMKDARLLSIVHEVLSAGCSQGHKNLENLVNQEHLNATNAKQHNKWHIREEAYKTMKSHLII